MTFFDSYTLHGGAQITIQNETISNWLMTSPVYSGYRLNSNGLVYKQNAAGSWISLGYYWITPQSEVANYEVRATLASGDTPSGTLGSWTNLGSTQSWGLTAAPLGAAVTCDLTIDIRDAATQTIRDTATITIAAEAVN